MFAMACLAADHQIYYFECGFGLKDNAANLSSLVRHLRNELAHFPFSLLKLYNRICRNNSSLFSAYLRNPHIVVSSEIKMVQLKLYFH